MRDFIDFILSDKIYLGAFTIIVILTVVLLVLSIKLARGNKKPRKINTIQNTKNNYEQNVQHRPKQNESINLSSNKENLKTESLAVTDEKINDKSPNLNRQDLGSDIGQIPMLDPEIKAGIINDIKNDNKVYETEALYVEPPKAPIGETVILAKPKPKSLATLTYEENNQIIDYQIVNNIINIGRDPESCDMTISSDTHIGRKHALIYCKEDKFYLTDLNSRNGTYINEDRIQGERQIYDGDEIKLATTKLKFKTN